MQQDSRTSTRFMAAPAFITNLRHNRCNNKLSFFFQELKVRIINPGLGLIFDYAGHPRVLSDCSRITDSSWISDRC